MINKDVLRGYFPVTKQYTFLNNAAESPMNLKYRQALDAFYDIACNAPQDKPDTRDEVRKKLSFLFGGFASDYALVNSTGIGSGIVAAGLSIESGDNVVVASYEHRNNLFPWLALKDKGVEIRFIPVEADGEIKLSSIEQLVDEKTKVVTLAAVRFNSGFRIDLKAVSKIAHKHDALLCVDGIQACGVVPIQVIEMGIDVLSSAGFKWLLGVPGTGFLYVNEKARARIKPVIPGMFAAEASYTSLTYHKDSRKYETGSIAYSLFNAWLAGLDIVLEYGVDQIYEEVLRLTQILISGFKQREIKILSHVETEKNRSGILFFTLDDHSDNHKLQEQLEKHHIIISVREGNCRISPSFYNTDDEIKYFFNVLDDYLD